MATYFRLPIERQIFDNNGDPLNGGKLYTYEAGTTTNKTTYQDDGGMASHTNPIILDSSGKLPADVWGTTGGYKVNLVSSADVQQTGWPIDDIVGINDASQTAASEWVASGLTPTYISATSFSLAGDQTTVFHAGRRLRIVDSGGTDYGTILTSVFGAVTTITVVLDSGSIDSGISAVSYGLISAVNPSVRAGLSKIVSGTVSAAATLDITGITTAYRAILLVFDNLAPATDNQNLYLRLSDDAGSTYEADASDYAWAHTGITEASTSNAVGDDADSEIHLGSGFGDQAGEKASGQITLYNPADSGITHVTFEIARQDQTPVFVHYDGAGHLQAAGATAAFRLLFASGNIATMNYTVYGLTA